MRSAVRGEHGTAAIIDLPYGDQRIAAHARQQHGLRTQPRSVPTQQVGPLSRHRCNRRMSRVVHLRHAAWRALYPVIAGKA
jgi:hypothetical protein